MDNQSLTHIEPKHRIITDDIIQVRIPLPFALNQVNCYLLRGADGWSVLDTGLNSSAARSAWVETLQHLGIAPEEISQIVLTHVHPDHYGLAGWMQRGWQDGNIGHIPPVRLSSREAEIVTTLWSAEANWESAVRRFWLTCGVPERLTEEMVRATGETRLRVVPHPISLQILEVPGQVILGGRRLQVIHTPGHSDGHLIFYDEADRLLLCGDHVLPKITSNIGLWPNGEPDPLGRYLTSLEDLAAMPVRLALPGHGPLITDFPGRIAELRQHHDERLALTATVAAEGVTVYQACQQIFPFARLSMHEKRFAVAETLAHLEHLVVRKQLRRQGAQLWRFLVA